jgi:hypothetical protein
VVKNFFTTAADGKRYATNFYNLDAIISVGYRVKSAVATRFRIWATERLREYIVKGFTMDDERLKNPDQPLTNWRGAVIRKQDVAIAKNYLSEPELEALNNLVEQYLIFAQGQAMRRVPMHMADWIEKLNGFLTLNDRDILTHAGRISHEMAQAKAELEYDKFKALSASAPRPVDADFDEATKDLKKLPPPKKPRKPKA